VVLHRLRARGQLHPANAVDAVIEHAELPQHVDAAEIRRFGQDGGAVGARQGVEDLIRFAKKDPVSKLQANPAVRYELVDRMVEAGVATQMSLKIISIQAKEGVAPGHEASVAKMYGTELNQRISRTALKVLGLHGQLDSKSEGVDASKYGRYKYQYLRAIANTIEGGTSEIQRNIIATRGLGLPRA
jgi:alkylation response protein AidB-like acyl-CoA dehydrogenase